MAPAVAANFPGKVEQLAGWLRAAGAKANSGSIATARLSAAPSGAAGLLWIDEPICPALGIMPDPVYRGACFRLEPGDALLLYTDGVTEAERADLAQYGEERLLRRIGSLPADVGARSLVDAVVRDVERFAAGTPPSDDITLLCLRYRGA